MTITAEEVRRLFDYNPETGELFWKRREGASRQWNGRFAGKRAGSMYVSRSSDRSYWQVTIWPKVYRQHCIIWLWLYGVWPTAQIDHENTDGLDNRQINLREATNAQNAMNRGAVNGLKGASFHRATGKWRARITVDYREVHLGLFDSEEAAHAAYWVEAQRLHGNFARAA